jgi:hypothetical protein
LKTPGRQVDAGCVDIGFEIRRHQAPGGRY